MGTSYLQQIAVKLAVGVASARLGVGVLHDNIWEEVVEKRVHQGNAVGGAKIAVDERSAAAGEDVVGVLQGAIGPVVAS